MKEISSSIINGRKLISSRQGVIKNIVSVSRGTDDPLITSMGNKIGDTTLINGEKCSGRSSGCGFNIEETYMSTIGETVERYSCAFYNKKDLTYSSFNKLDIKHIKPSEYALFHENQHKLFSKNNFKMQKFTDETEIYWDICKDLTNGNECYCPASYIYLPWSLDNNFISTSTSTGLSSHTNYYKAVLTSLYEVIERDSFVLTWHQKITNKKIIITKEIRSYINEIFPSEYEWHFFDMTYDIKVPSVFGICIGKAEFGDFVIVATATRSTLSDALKKVIMEVAQSLPYYRYLNVKRKGWIPSDDFNKLLNFEDHSLFYNRKQEYMHVFDDWRNAEENTLIDFNQKDDQSAFQNCRKIIKILKDKEYNVLLKDLTTPDINQCGFYCIRIVVPQLLLMSGAYPFYHLGSKRLYEVPKEMGLKPKTFENLNKYPHPFP